MSQVLDPFDLPEWLGTEEVTWHAETVDRGEHHVRGRLTCSGREQECDLLAVDQAFPAPVVDEGTRRLAHQAWRNGEVLLVSRDGRLTLAAPGTAFSADAVLALLARLARAVGGSPQQFVAALRVGVVGTD